MDELTRLLGLQALAQQLDDAAKIARAMRDAAVYDYVADPDVNRRELCRQMGISSPRLYGILTAERDRRLGPDDELTAGMLFELNQAESLAIWEDAVEDWENAGKVGSPEDYFDLNRLHVAPRA